MIIGIGVDIQKISEICIEYLKIDDPFVKKTFALEEIEKSKLHINKNSYFAMLFSGKEAVFKSLGIDSDNVLLNEIIITENEASNPVVKLSGKLFEIANLKKIDEILISFSNNEEYFFSYAIAQSLN